MRVSRRPAVPVEAHGGRVVLELAAGRLEDGLDQVLHGFARMHLRARGDQRRRGRRLAALRSSMPSVRNISRSPGSSGSGCTRYVVVPDDPERRVGPQVDRLDAAAAQPQR